MTLRRVAYWWLVIDLLALVAVSWHGGRGEANAHPLRRNGGRGWY